MKTLLLLFLIAMTAISAGASTKVRRQSDIDKGHATLLGITVGVDSMARVGKRLGHATLFNFNKGTHKRAVEALCYAAPDSTRLLFVAGTEGRAQKVARLRVTASDVAVKYGPACLKSKAFGKGVATGSGLRLGMTEAEVRSLLGEPTDESPGFLGYEYHHHRALTDKEVGVIEAGHPDVRLYPYQDISSSVEARFADGLLKRLDIIRFSTY